MNKTIDYYEKNAISFASDTFAVEFIKVQNRFASFIGEGGYILDFGCGSGRDVVFFLNKGYTVDAIDGSKKLCEIASNYTGLKVRQMLFTDLDEEDKYDGIWACSSILHLPKSDLKDVFEKMIRALKTGGHLYTSFKYGEFEGDRNGRYFTDFTEKSFEVFIEDFPEIMMIEEWVSSDARPGRSDEKWLNIILQKI